MINYNARIRNFNKGKNKINKDILIIGAGRWGKVLLSEIAKNFINIKKIYIFTGYQDSLKKWVKKNKYKNVFILKKFSETKKIKSCFSLIANKNKDHFRYCYKLLNQGYNVLIEKPFILNLEQSNKLIKLSGYKKLFLLIGLQFFYANYLYYIKDKIIKKSIIKSINFEWFDEKNKKRNNILKKHDLSVKYIEDVFYHAYSILYILLGKNSFKFNKKISNINKIEKLKFEYHSREIEINCSRNWSCRKRILKINFYNGKSLLINFSKDNQIKVRLNNKIIKVPINYCDKTIKYQLFSYFKLKNYQSNKAINDIRNLKNLLEGLKGLRKQY